MLLALGLIADGVVSGPVPLESLEEIPHAEWNEILESHSSSIIVNGESYG